MRIRHTVFLADKYTYKNDDVTEHKNKSYDNKYILASLIFFEAKTFSLKDDHSLFIFSKVVKKL